MPFNRSPQPFPRFCVCISLVEKRGTLVFYHLRNELPAMASQKSPSSRRPKFMRASATCPQLATSNASRKDLASLHSCGATTILTRVASYSSAQHEHAMRTSPMSSCSSPGQITEERRKDPFEITISQCELIASDSILR